MLWEGLITGLSAIMVAATVAVVVVWILTLWSSRKID
jgi:hypothetical protein